MDKRSYNYTHVLINFKYRYVNTTEELSNTWSQKKWLLWWVELYPPKRCRCPNSSSYEWNRMEILSLPTIKLRFSHQGGPQCNMVGELINTGSWTRRQTYTQRGHHGKMKVEIRGASTGQETPNIANSSWESPCHTPEKKPPCWHLDVGFGSSKTMI